VEVPHIGWGVKMGRDGTIRMSAAGAGLIQAGRTWQRDEATVGVDWLPRLEHSKLSRCRSTRMAVAT